MIDLYGPEVLVVIPTLNERSHIGALLQQRLAELDAISGHLVVADGGSTDGTIEIAKDIAHRDRRVTVLHNPWRIQSAAMNLAVERFGDGCEFVIRIDAHGGYPADYCDRLVLRCGQIETAELLLLRDYAESVINDEWPALQDDRSSERTAERLTALTARVAALDPAPGRQAAVYADLLRAVEGLGITARSGSGWRTPACQTPSRT